MVGGILRSSTQQNCKISSATADRGSPFIVSDLDETETQPFFLFVVASADVWSAKALNPSDEELAKQKLSRTEFNAIIEQQQETQTKQLAGIPGGSYRLMLFDLPGFIHRSFTDQTLVAVGNQEGASHDFHVAQTYTLAFFDKFLKEDAHTILDIGEPADRRARLEKFPARTEPTRK
jgi:hypothetical protein